jgi:tRNA-dihydrouridine synthase A
MREEARIAEGKTPPVSIAPMMERTDRHYRYFIRGITERTLLYTEMIATGAIRYGDSERVLGYHPIEHPLALQLGGDDPEELAESVRIAEAFDYDEYNLNIGCPSDRVQNGAFGACLMAKPGLVARMVEALKAVTDKPVTVKHRIGIDGRERYEDMRDFVETVAKAGADRFTVHARIAVLGGLSPKENRNVPPLRYEDVYRLKEEFPELPIELNGHVHTLSQMRDHMAYVDAVMLGRAAYDDPCVLAPVDELFFGHTRELPTRYELVQRMIPYMREWQAVGISPRSVIRHMLGLFASQPGARKWKQVLSGKIPDEVDPEELMERALDPVPDEVKHRPLGEPQPV